MNWKRVIWLLPLVLCAVAAHARAPIVDVESSPIPAGLTLDQIERAIIVGTQRGWVMKPIAPGHIEAKLSVRSHLAVVDIHYDESAFSIRYQTSRNLNYKAGNTDECVKQPRGQRGGSATGSSTRCARSARIHRNYNRWVRNLEMDLNQSLLLLRQARRD